MPALAQREEVNQLGTAGRLADACEAGLPGKGIDGAGFACIGAAGEGYLGQTVLWTGLERRGAGYELSLVKIHSVFRFAKPWASIPRPIVL